MQRLFPSGLNRKNVTHTLPSPYDNLALGEHPDYALSMLDRFALLGICCMFAYAR